MVNKVFGEETIVCELEKSEEKRNNKQIWSSW